MPITQSLSSLDQSKQEKKMESIQQNNTNDTGILLFKQNSSADYSQLRKKYFDKEVSPEKLHEEMLFVLQRKVSDLQALRIHRDKLKFISTKNSSNNNNPIKITLTDLKQKARTQQKVLSAIHTLQEDINFIDDELNTMTEYHNFLKNSLSHHIDDEDMGVIDLQEEEKVMIENLEDETKHLLRELHESENRNAREIRQMHIQIGNLRISIKQKQNKIRDLKSKICTMHIKLNSKHNFTNKQKSISLSIKKFNNQHHSNLLQEAFIGNKNFKNFSKQLIQKINQQDELVKIVFFSEEEDDHLRESVTFQLIYNTFEGRHHKLFVSEQGQSQSYMTNYCPIKNIQQKSIKVKQTQISVKHLLSIKFFFTSKIVGVECRIKTDRGNKSIAIGKCKPNVDYELLTLVNKKIVTMSSFWHQRQMIGVGIWYLSKLQPKGRVNSFSRQKLIKNLESQQSLTNQCYNEYYAS